VVAQSAFTGAGIAITHLARPAAIVVAVVTVMIVGAAAIFAFTSPLSWTPER
jgi:hypothetical protein